MLHPFSDGYRISESRGIDRLAGVAPDRSFPHPHTNLASYSIVTSPNSLACIAHHHLAYSVALREPNASCIHPETQSETLAEELEDRR